MLPAVSGAESFTADERARLAPFFTNLDGHVFALTNLPETVKGALFARYSRSAKSLRRLFLDEFADKVRAGGVGRAGSSIESAAVERAERLYARVFSDYGDDSVAQLGGAHIACEYVSNVLTKVLEWGRLMSYLEQSTRYVPYTDRLHGRWRYHVPAELDSRRAARPLRAHDGRGVRVLRRVDSAHAGVLRGAPSARRATTPRRVHRAAIRAKALDTLRGLLPAATQSNVGLFGSGQAFESLLLRMRAHPLLEVRACADEMLVELRKVIPAFLTRRRSAGSRRTLVAVSCRRTRDQADRLCRAAAAGRRAAERARRSHALRFRSGWRDRRSSPPRSTRRPRCPTISCSASPGGCRLTIRAQVLRAYVGDRGESPAPARPRVRAHVVSLRRAHRLRRVPRSAAPSAADARMAAADDAARLQRAGGDRRGRRPRRLAAGDGRIGRTARAARMRADTRPLRRTRWRWPTACASTWT